LAIAVSVATAKVARIEETVFMIILERGGVSILLIMIIFEGGLQA
jgi:hypothetical protein